MTEQSAPVKAVTPRRRTAMSKKTTRAAALDASALPSACEPTHEEISLRAYFISQRRQGQPGNPDEDWHRAIHELRAERK